MSTVAARSLLRVAAAGRPRSRFAFSVLLGVVGIGSAVGLLATSGYLISKAALRPSILSLTVAIVGVRFFGIARALARYFERLVSHDFAFRALSDHRVRFYERLLRAAPAGLRRTRGADLLSRFVGDVDSLQHLYVRAVGPPMVALGVTGLAVAIAWALLPAAGAVLAVFLLLASVCLPLVSGLGARDAGRRQAPARAELTAELVELFEGAPELVVYGQEAHRLDRLRAADLRFRSLARRDALLAGLTDGLGLLLSGCAVVAVLIVSVPAVRSGTLNGVDLAVLALLSFAAFEAVAPLPAAAQHLSASAKAAERLEHLGSGERPVADPPEPRSLIGPPMLSLEQARLRYAPDGPWVLDGADLLLAPGRHVALLGASGAGKTSLAQVLVRFRDLDGGRVALNGHDLAEYAQRDIRSLVCLCDQEAHLFTTTIRENVRLAKPTATDAEITEALARAHAWNWVASLPDGLDTQVGENGAQVSGGQRQRIALARALLSEARILIFDEPTAHLDPASAAAFVEDLVDASEGIALLLITHNRAILGRFDEVLVLEHGHTRPG